MKKQILFFVAPLIFLISVTTEIAWGQDVYLEGTTGSGVYTSPANIIAQNNFTIDNGVQVHLIAHDSTILRPGSSVKAGGILISFESDRDLLPDDWEMEHFEDLLHDPNDHDDDDLLTNIDEYLNNTDPRDEDSDDDGMPDDWEVQYSLNPIINDANVDGDTDGLTNLEEYLEGTDPNVSDSDGDGMTDGWEVQYNLLPLEDDAEGHADSDGLTNIYEFLNGTNPVNPDTDGDGMLDSWEVQYDCLNPLVKDGEVDFDEDDLSNYLESILEKNPEDPDDPGAGIYYEYDELGRIKILIRKQ